MKKNIVFVIGILVIVLLNAFAFTQKDQNQKNHFNIDSANRTLTSIQGKSAIHPDYQDILFAIGQLEDLQNGAKKCVDEANTHLDLINQLLKTTVSDHAPQFQHADYQYLQSKQLYYSKQLSECRLFVYRSEEAIADYKDTMQKISANFILRRNDPLWKIDSSNWSEPQNDIDVAKVWKISGINQLTQERLIVGGVLLSLLFILSWYVRLFFLRIKASIENNNSIGSISLIVLSKSIVPIALLGFICVYFNFINAMVFPTPTMEKLSHAALIFVLSIAATRFLFYPSRDTIGFFAFPTQWGRLFYERIWVLLLTLFLGYAAAISLRDQIFSSSFVDFVGMFYIVLIGALISWIFLLWYRSPQAQQLRHATLIFISTLFLIVLGAIIVTECLGYHRLAIFLIVGFCLTIFYTLFFIASWRLIGMLFEWIENPQYIAAKKIKHLFGVKMNKTMHEFSLIKISAQLIILTAYIIAMLKSWSIASNFVDVLIDTFFIGFKFSGLTIIPSRIVLALLSFSMIFLIGRFIAATLARQHHFKGEEDTQIAISTIIIYISFFIAVIFALLTTGIDFTGLAIVAGALSVGVGLGLQNIVNNFVSGLILLIEKPIKPGDRIVIGKTEGFVRRIRIRSTQIATQGREDVIVPNADLITQQVTNYMFRDRNSRINCQVGVAYVSDIHLVKKILLELANKHEDVIHQPPNEPVVLFTKFGESSLIFDLLCVIHDVNKKYVVVSDLNFAIDAAFRVHKIEIAFPQQDIHIKSMPTMRSDQGE